jgi:hypothetical protein
MKASPEQQVRDWNEIFPVGQQILYWKGVAGDGPGTEGVTRNAAEVLGGHTAVVWVEGVPGCIALSHIEVPERFGVFYGTPKFKVNYE